jgi:hypothetical protein
MTRAALRILNRSRADAWRRVGMPSSWVPEAPASGESGGQNVAGEADDHAGNGRPVGETPSANDSKTES